MNSFTLVGRVAGIGREVQDEKHPLFFTLAAARGEYTDFIGCEVWGKLALSFQHYKKVGDQLAISGYLKVDSYEKGGERFYHTRCVVTRCEYLATPPKKQAPIPDRGPSEVANKDLPF